MRNYRYNTRCNKKATHISASWGFRACKQHVVSGMIPYRRELDVPCKYESDFQRCDQPLVVVAMAGLHGYLPNYCETHTSYENALEDLVQIHELGRDRERKLKRDSYLELNLKRDGNEYCEIIVA